MPEKLKILVSAYACSPYQGSEPGMGWNFVLGLSQFHEVHVISEKLKWEPEIEKEFSKKPELNKNLKFYFIEKKRNKILRKIWPPSYYWYYRQWQKEAYQLALELDLRENFDIIHQLNMVGFREPGYLWKINKPFVWGPIGGMENTSWKLLLNLDLKNLIYYLSRNIINWFQIVLLIRPRKAAQRPNNFLIAATPKNQENIKKYWKCESSIITEVGQEEKQTLVLNERLYNNPLRIIWSGQHTGGKALNILLNGLSLLPDHVKWQLSILGSGKMTFSWKRLAKKLNLEKNIHWTGWINKKEAHSLMEGSHVICITSIKDLTSTVTLEALSFGLPVICIDHCGFSHVINETCGIKIPVSNPKKLISGFSQSITNLYENEPWRLQMSRGAINRAAEFSWKNKIDQLNTIYELLLNKSNPS